MQSTSYNRVLVAGSEFLYDTGEAEEAESRDVGAAKSSGVRTV